MKATASKSTVDKVITVHMVGADLNAHGGISSVESLILLNCPPDVRIRHIPTYSACTTPVNMMIFLRAFLTLAGVLAFNRTQLVHFHFAERGSTMRKIILLSLVLLFRKPFVLHSHGAAYKEFYNEAPAALRKLAKTVFRHCRKFIALSHNWLDFYSQAFGLTEQQGVVLPNPIPIPTPCQAPRRRDHVSIIFMGHIGPRKGLLDRLGPMLAYEAKQDKGAFDLIRAFAALPLPERSTARLVLAGSGQTGEARALAAELGVEDLVTVRDWLNPEERDKLLENGDIFVLPSYHEGLPMALLEAMACAIPPITTPVGGIPEVVTHNQNGLLVTPGNQAELTSATQRLLRDPELRTALGTAARDSVRRFNVPDYMGRLCGLYREALTAAPGEYGPPAIETNEHAKR